MSKMIRFYKRMKFSSTRHERITSLHVSYAMVSKQAMELFVNENADQFVVNLFQNAIHDVSLPINDDYVVTITITSVRLKKPILVAYKNVGSMKSVEVISKYNKQNLRVRKAFMKGGIFNLSILLRAQHEL